MRYVCCAYRKEIAMKLIENLILDEERALYASKDAIIRNCTFAGPADGESALKECRRIRTEHCHMELRYPYWHNEQVELDDITMTETCRAALWYCSDVAIHNSNLGGIKALRECKNVTVNNTDIVSTEWGWYCNDICMSHCRLTAEYAFLNSKNVIIDHLDMKGKYSFQYMENVEIRDSYLDTKDAFWHSKNVTVVNSVVKGEYLAWYSEGLHLINCKIIGTQPLCYAKGLILENCEMVDTDLAFENSDVSATICGHIDSVKNPHKGRIEADSIGEVIIDENRWNDEEYEIILKN